MNKMNTDQLTFAFEDNIDWTALEDAWNEIACNIVVHNYPAWQAIRARAKTREECFDQLYDEATACLLELLEYKEFARRFIRGGSK